MCAECDAMYPCPDSDQCQRTTAEGRTGLCPQCEQEEGVVILSRSEDGFEAIIWSRPKIHLSTPEEPARRLLDGISESLDLPHRMAVLESSLTGDKL